MKFNSPEKKKNWIVGKKCLLDGKRSKMLGYDLEH